MMDQEEANAGEAEDEVLTAGLLRHSAGLERQAFPKTYHVRVTYGFFVYLFGLTAFIFGYTGFMHYYHESQGRSFQKGMYVFVTLYLAFIFSIIAWQVPRRVVREDDKILVHFFCRTRVVPIDSILEVRIARRRRLRSGAAGGGGSGRRRLTCLCCRYPKKCIWGYPTNLDMNVVLVTKSCCNNYCFSLHEMDEFVADNAPVATKEVVVEPDDGEEVEAGNVQLELSPEQGGAEEPQPSVIGAGTAGPENPRQE